MSKKYLLSAEELSAFSLQLSLTVKTGIPLSEAIMILMEDSETKTAKDIYGKILEDLEMGGSLSAALRKTEIFPPYMTQMIEIGEASGRLEYALDSLHKYYSREANVSKSAKSAVTYPAIMLVILVVIILIMIIKVLPFFSQIFNSLGGEVSPLAASAIRMGEIISDYSVVFIGIVVVIALVLVIMRISQSGRALQIKLGQEVFRKLGDKMASAKFASAMALMLASGLDIDQSVELTVPLITNPRMHAKVVALKEMMDAGTGFSESVVKTGIFTGMQARMLSLGFKSGNLDTIMDHIADDYEKEVDERLEQLISIIEPTMVAVLCIIVGLILLSAMLPLLGVMSSIM